MNNPSIKDIARIAGVAPSTVSTILNGKEESRRISHALVQKVLNIAKQKGYTPNQVAVSLRTGSSKIIGLLVEDISNVFYASIASIIEDQLKTFGYRVVYCSTKNDPANCIELINMLYQRQVDGYIITPVEGIENALKSLTDKRKPVILIDRYFKELNLSHVLVDDKTGMYDGMNHLIGNGYKNIGFVTVDLAQTQMNYREQAYKQFLKEHDMEFREERILKIPFRTSSEVMVEQLVTFIRDTPDMNALFFSTNYLCIAGLQSLQRLKLSIPHEMALISFDDHELFSIYPPGITAIRQPVKEIGHNAVSLLIDYLQLSTDHFIDKHLFIPGKLMVRGSTKSR